MQLALMRRQVDHMLSARLRSKKKELRKLVSFSLLTWQAVKGLVIVKITTKIGKWKVLKLISHSLHLKSA